MDARVLRRRRGRWAGRCPRGCRGGRTCQGFLWLRALPSTAGLTRTDCAVIAPPLRRFSLVGRTVTQLPAVTSGRPADVNSAESAHWKRPAAKRSGTDSTAAATATPTEPCTSSWSCACVVTNPPATTSPVASRKAKPKTRSCDASNATSSAKSSAPYTRPEEPPNPLPEQGASGIKGTTKPPRRPYRTRDRQAGLDRQDRHRLHRAYLLKEGLRHVFSVKGEEGRQALDRWISWARRCRIPVFVKLAGRVVRHRDAIDAALDHGLSQGLIESTNTKIRLLTRIAFGFRSPEALIALAMLALGGHRPSLPGRTRHPRISQ